MATLGGALHEEFLTESPFDSVIGLLQFTDSYLDTHTEFAAGHIFGSAVDATVGAGDATSTVNIKKGSVTLGQKTVVTDGIDSADPYDVVFTNVKGAYKMLATEDAVILDNTGLGAKNVSTVTGNAKNNDILGDSANNTINADKGNDFVHGRDGNDTINGGLGNDSLEGDNGNDSLKGDAGNDTLDGGAGNDKLDGGLDSDELRGGEGNDILLGVNGNDTLDGGDGKDSLDGGNDNDVLFGGAGKDTMKGSAGNDSLDGGAGADKLDGGTGNDQVDGGFGNDTLTGGAGSDTFVISDNNGFDYITDFGFKGTGKVSGQFEDKIQVVGHDSDSVEGFSTGDFTVGTAFDAVIISFNDGGAVLLKGITDPAKLYFNDAGDYFTLNPNGEGTDTISIID